MSRNDIECPGDIVSYNCSIQSNSEMVHLTWHVTLPGQMPVNITYYGMSYNRTNLSSYISTYLTGFRSDEFIHSTLEVTVHPDIPTDQIILQCSIDNLANDTTIVLINTSSEIHSNHSSFHGSLCATLFQSPSCPLVSTSLENIMVTWRPQLLWTGTHHRVVGHRPL